MVQLDGNLKLDKLGGVLHAIDGSQQGQPEALGVLLFVSSGGPVGGELFGGGFLFYGFHSNTLPERVVCK